MRNIYLVFFLLLSGFAFGQQTDCEDAETICANSTITFTPQGSGNNDFASPNNGNGCLGGNENSSAWYYFEIQAAAPPNLLLGFTITPQGANNQDYDFAIYGPDVPCTNLGNPIRCSFAAPGCAFCPQTGLGNGTTDVSEGTGGDGFVSEITVEPGQGYFLLVDNYSNNGIGFDLDFTGPGAPWLDCNVQPPCGLVTDAGPAVTSCAGSTLTALNGSSSGGMGGEFYSWMGSNGSTIYLSNPNIPNPTLNFPPGVTGVFTFTLTTTEGVCSDDDVVTVTINPGPNVTVSDPSSACSEDAPYTLFGTPSGGTWSPNAPNGFINPASLGVGFHVVEYSYTDANGCDGTASTTVEIYPSPIVSIDVFQTEFCVNDDPSFLFGTPFGGQWSPNVPGGVLVPNNLGVGIWIISYSYTDQFTGCSDMDEIQITILPEPTATIIDPGPLCEGGAPVLLDATPPGGEWGGAATAGVFFPSNYSPGFYEVTYTYYTAFGCATTTTANLEVTPGGTADISAPPALCTGSGTYTLTADPPGGTWGSNTPNGVIDPATLGAGSQTATYSVQSPGGCELTASETFTIGSEPIVNITDIGNLCSSGNPQTLSATPSGGTWSANAPGGVFNPNIGAGNYVVSYTYTDGSGCVGSDDLNVQVFAAPTVSITGGNTFCPGGSLQLMSSGTFSAYQWSDNSTGNSLTVSSDGTYSLTVTDANGCTASAQQTVTQGNPISTSITGNTQICAGTPTSLFAEAGFTSYAWSNGNTTNTISVNIADTYTVTVTDASGCTGSAQTTVTNFTPPSPSISGDVTFCSGQTATLNAGNFVSYIWSTNETTPSIMVGTAGIYEVTVTDANSCTGIATVNISENNIAAPTISGFFSFCENESTLLSADAGYTSYSWSTGESSESITVNQPGNISVTVTDGNNCTSESTVMVTQNNAPAPTISGVFAICAGTTTNLDAGTYSSYIWSNGETTNPITVNQAENYSVTVTDGNNCIGVAQVTVDITPSLQPMITGGMTICDGGSTSLDAGAGYDTYIWGNGETTNEITVGTAGTYEVTVSDASGCTGTATTIVTTNAVPTPNITGDNSFCPGGNATLNAGTYSSYLWSTNETTAEITVSTSETFTVTVTDANSCTGVASFTVSENTIADPNIMGDLAFCENSSTVLTAETGFTNYSWSTGETTPSVTINQTGNVTVTVTDGNNCTSETTVMVIENSSPTPDISGILAICAGTTTSLDAGTYSSYIWSNGETTNPITVNQAENYSVTVTDGNNCTGVAQVTVDITPSLQPMITGIMTICDGASTSLDAGAGYDTYIWDNGETTNEITVATAGTYEVTVSDASGCTGTATTTVATNTAPTPNITGDNSFCPSGNATLNAGTYSSYLWSTNETTAEITVATSETFTVTVTDANSCTGVASFTVSENTIADPNIIGDLTFCENSSTVLTAETGFTNYSWSTGETTPSVTINQTGNVTVTVTDGNNCTSETTVMVMENSSPTPDISGILAICAGTTTSLDAGTYSSYIWSNSETSNSIIVDEAGSYSVTVTDGNGCTGVDQVTVDINSTLEPTITGVLAICDGTTTTLDAGAGYDSYSWSNSETTNSITVSAEGTYSVTVSDASGCTGTAEVAVTENQTNTPTIIGEANFCAGANTTLEVSETFNQYLWSNGATTPTTSIAQDGMVGVTVTDANGCTTESSLMVIENPNPSPTIVGATSICTGANTMLEAGSGFASYQWSNNSTADNISVSDAGLFSVTVTDANGCTGTDDVTVTVTAELEPTITGDLDFCNNASTSLDAGNGFDTYEWSNGEMTQIINPDESGIYTVIVSDVNGCTGSTQVSVTEFAEPTPQISGSTSFCTGTTTTLDAGTDFDTYLWSENSTTSSITVSTAGTYAVTVTTTDGCTGTATVDIVESTSLNPVIVGDLSFCPAGNTTLDAGLGFSSYEWSDGSVGQTLEVTQNGDYTVTVEDASGCSGTATVSVAESTPPTANILGQNSFCTGSTTSLDAGGGFANYEWSDGSFAQVLEVTQSGLYSLTITDTNGCTDEASLNVQELASLNPDVTGTLDFCENSSTIISAATGFATYEWSNNSDSSALEVMLPGDYTVTVTDLNGCSGEQTVSVLQNNTPTTAITGDLAFCQNETSTISADAGFASYLWSDNSTEMNLITNISGTYTVTITNVQGCTGTASVDVIEFPEPTPNISGATSFCNNTSTTLDASGNFTDYLWSNDETTPTIDVAQAGIFTVTVTDGNGCTATDEVTVTISSSLSPSIVGATSFCSGNSTTLDASGNYTEYLWSDTSTDAILEVNQSGTYTVTVTDASGCTGTAEAVVNETSSLLPTFTGTPSFCPTESTIINAESGYATYLWSDGTMEDNITITDAGTYTVTVSDASGCTGTSEISVTENTPPAPMIAGSTTFCSGFSSTLDVGNNFATYLWSDNSTGSTLVADVEGLYAVTVTDANGCTGETSIQVTESNQLEPTISGATDICTGTMTLLDAGSGFATYEWSDGSTGQTLDVATAGDYTVTVSDASGCTGEVSVAVSENPPVSAGTANAPTSFCNSIVTTIVLFDELTGADANGQWTETSDNASTGSAFDIGNGIFNTDGQASGIYTFEYVVAGMGACPNDQATVSIIIEETPEAIIATANAIDCIDDTQALDASTSSGGTDLIYQWTTTDGNILMGDDSATPTIDAGGTYELIVSLPNGCSSTSSIVVVENTNEPDADAGMAQQLTCATGEVTLSGTSTVSGATYTWSGPGINANNMNEQNPTVGVAGIYELVVTNPQNGCASVAVAVEVLLATNAPSFTLNPVGQLDCENSAQVLTGPISDDFIYQWFFNGDEIIGATEPNYEANQGGIYGLQITDTSNGCSSTEVLEIIDATDQPAAEAGTADLLSCDAGQVTLDGTGSSVSSTISYEWLDGNNNVIPNSNSLTINVTQAGTYTLVVTDNFNGCSMSDEVTVVADTDFPTADAGTDAMLNCNFDAIQIGGTPPSGNYFSFTWTVLSGGVLNNPTSFNPSVNEAGVYELTVTNTTNGCSATDQITISENTNLPVEVIYELTPIECADDANGVLTILDVEGGTAPYQFQLSNGGYSDLSTFAFLDEGDYILNVVDELGCELQANFALVNPAPFILDLGDDQIIKLGEEVELTTIGSTFFDSISWRPHETLPCDNCLDPLVSPLQTTTYQAVATNPNGCTDSDDITIFVEKERKIFIPNIFTPNNDGVNDRFFINAGDEVENISVFKIFNRWGEEIYSTKDIQPNDLSVGWDGFFRGKKMNPGVFVYYAEIEFIDGEKIIYKGDVALRR